MSEIKNPFSKIRAEQMGNSAWKYFVKNPFKDYISEKPLIFEGSRGTGKSMFFICNSWREKWKECEEQNIFFRQFIQNNPHIGFYYKADGRFTKSLSKRNVEDNIWIGIFNTYINVVIAKEILCFIETAISNNISLPDSAIEKILSLSSFSLKIEKPKSLAELKMQLDYVIIQISQFTNYTEDTKPVGTNPGQLIEVFAQALKECDIHTDTTFHIFIDEYEVLTKEQQIQINTLIKQSNSILVYDIGVITKGLYSYETISGQRIQPKDDFTVFNADTFFNYNNKEEYNEFLIEICKKRFEIAYQGKLESILENEDFTDIRYYLGKFTKDYDFQRFAKKLKKKNVVKEKIEKLLDTAYSVNYNKEERDRLLGELIDESDPVKTRMHLAILLRRGKDGILPTELLNEKNNQTPRYKDWQHNTQDAIYFLLAKELDIRRAYFGFNIFSLLSSGVVRSFLELVEYAFDFAFNNEFSFNSPRPISPEEQTSAVYFVSQFKISEIESYEPNGFQLKTFVLALGKIFSNIQLNSNNTLGEPEQNHFYSNFIDLRKQYPKAAQLIEQAIMNCVLQEEVSTKNKNPETTLENMDYHLNHIYCPQFRISHNRKRKIFLKTEDLANLLLGNQEQVEQTIKTVSSNYENPSQPLNLFSSL